MPAPSSSTVSIVSVMVETCSPALDASAMMLPDISSTQMAGSRVISGAATARNTMISMTRMTSTDRSSVRCCAWAWEFWLSTALGSCPVR